jgi:TonB family protein
LRVALSFAAFACATISLAQSRAATPPAAPPDPQQAPQQAAPPGQTTPAPETQPAPPSAAPADQAKPSAVDPTKPATEKPTAEELREAAVTEDNLKQQLAGKTFYLRGGYQDNTLHFDEKGSLDGSSPKASYTLSLVQIDRVKVDKHHVQLEGVRYGVHFLGALSTEDQSANVDKVRLTSKKKPLKITIDREIVVTPKKQKQPKQDKNKGKPVQQAAAQTQQQQQAVPPQETTVAPMPETPVSPVAPGFENTRRGFLVATSHAEADGVLHTALDRIFSTGIDDRMIATLPDYWKLYYKAIAEKTVYKPSDPAVLRSNQVDKKPQLTVAFEPPSNEYAQNNGVAGVALYQVVVGPDGRPQEVAIGRPIGFGLDENAIESIRKASFEPGMKDGKPVPVMVDLSVQFRIYSKRTAAAANDSAAADGAAPKPQTPSLPGPYSVNHP